jgi:hypothetical protein
LEPAQAAEMAGDAEKARHHYARVVEMAQSGDPSRQEFVAARAFMAKN